MGIWGPGVFENDDALDFIAELKDDTDARVLVEAIDRMKAPGEAPDVPDCHRALVAAELVAARIGKRSSDMPEEANAWLIDKPKPDPVVVAKAEGAVRTVLEESVLRVQWAESEEDFEDWKDELDELVQRLET
ncbi:MAG: DUF4259 domain-containing protein [Myxococcota bacterium]